MSFFPSSLISSPSSVGSESCWSEAAAEATEYAHASAALAAPTTGDLSLCCNRLCGCTPQVVLRYWCMRYWCIRYWCNSLSTHTNHTSHRSLASSKGVNSDGSSELARDGNTGLMGLRVALNDDVTGLELVGCAPGTSTISLGHSWNQSSAVRKFRLHHGQTHTLIRLVITGHGEDVITDANIAQANRLALVSALAHLLEKSLQA